jgi:flavin reductase (DIM6/NTAB) family NADH-FMN oxidoreductase RutF
MSVDAARFRSAMSHWATGVTIVTARAGDEIHGMTVSDFCGVSLEPPLVLVCADKTSNTHAVIARGGVFAVNLLRREQEALSNRFASKKEEHRRFEGLSCGTAVTGAPLIPGALASFDCRVVAAHDAGDHVIYVGRVEAIAGGEGDPLVYYGGAYRSLGLELGDSGAESG